MQTPPPANTLRAAFRHLATEAGRSVRRSAPFFYVPLAVVALGGGTATVLRLTGASTTLGRLLPWPVAGALCILLLVVTFAGAYARRPDSFPHERTWIRAKATFVILATIAFTSCYVALLTGDPSVFDGTAAAG